MVKTISLFRQLKEASFRYVPLTQMIQIYSAPVMVLALICFSFLIIIASSDPIRCSIDEKTFEKINSETKMSITDSCDDPLPGYRKANRLYRYYYITNVILIYTLLFFGLPCVGLMVYRIRDPYRTESMPMDLISILRGQNTQRSDESLEWFKIKINLWDRHVEFGLYFVLILLQILIIVPAIYIHFKILEGEFLALGFYVFKPSKLSLLFPREIFCSLGFGISSLGKQEEIFKTCRFHRNLDYAFTHLCAWYMYVYLFCVNLFFIGQLLALSCSKERRIESMKIKLPTVPDQYIERLANDRVMFFVLIDAYREFGLANFRDYMGLIIDRYIEKSNSYNRFAIDRDDNELFKEKSLDNSKHKITNFIRFEVSTGDQFENKSVDLHWLQSVDRQTNTV